MQLNKGVSNLKECWLSAIKEQIQKQFLTLTTIKTTTVTITTTMWAILI